MGDVQHISKLGKIKTNIKICSILLANIIILERNINFSQILQEALKKQIGVEL